MFRVQILTEPKLRDIYYFDKNIQGNEPVNHGYGKTKFSKSFYSNFFMIISILIALELALNYIFESHHSEFVIFGDSLSSLKAI